MNIEKILVSGHSVWVDKDAEINPPCFVAELLSTGLYDMFQIDTANDVDTKTQIRIVAASPKLNLEGVPTYLKWLAEQELPYGFTSWL